MGTDLNSISILPFNSIWPQMAKTVFIAPGARIIGDLTLAEHVNIWFNAVIRADVQSIRIGTASNIQDGAILHVTHSNALIIGDRVTVGHNAILHGCTIENEVLVGMHAVILDGAKIGEGSIIAAGTLIPPNCTIEAGSMVMGLPGRTIRKLSIEERSSIIESAQSYVELAKVYLCENNQ